MGKQDLPTPPFPASHFAYERAPKDRFWALLFGLTWAASIGLGIYAFTQRNPAYNHIDFSDPASCPYEGRNRALLEALQEEHQGEFSVSDFMRLTGRWLALSALLALGLGAVFIHLFKHHAATMTKATIATQIAIPAAMAVSMLAVGQWVMAGLLGGLALLTAWVFSLWRHQIELATRLLGVSAHALAANSGIITATILLNLASLLAITPLGVLIAIAASNGEVVPNPQRQGSAECVDAQGQQVLCCSWQLNSFANGYIALAVVTIMWTMLLANQVRVFVTAGAVAQWYFAPPSAISAAPRGTTMRSFKHAIGPSFGSLCLSSLVLTISQIVRNALERAQQDHSDVSILRLILIGLAQCFWALVEYLTKFATVMMAISGEAFLGAGRHVTDLLARNLLNAFASTVWFTPTVISLACFVLSAAWGGLTGGTYYWMHRHNPVEATPGLNATVLGSAVFVLSLFILNFLGGIMLSVLDAVFICWAIDRDSQTVSKPEVYAVLVTVPIPGAVVEQPDGGILYGAGQAGQAVGGPAGGGNSPMHYQPPVVPRV